MAIALPLVVQLFAPVQGFVDWLSGGEPREVAPVVQRTGEGPLRARSRTRPSPASHAARTWSGPTRASQSVRPVRVVRAAEGRPAARAAAGRMVISGRMADVCAELDRLADLETA